jgi:hypothetical protein
MLEDQDTCARENLHLLLVTDDTNLVLNKISLL